MPTHPRRSIVLNAVAVSLFLLIAGTARAGGSVSDTEVVFGMSAPFSGSAREYGRQLRVGYEVAFALANEGGGVNGRRLRLIALDDGYEPARTVTAVRDLVERHKVFGLIGVYGTANNTAVLPYVLEKQIFYFAPYSGATLLRKDPPDRYVFNYRPSYVEETAAAVNYLIKVRRVKPSEMAVFMQEDGFGEAGWEGLAKAMRRAGRDPSRVLRVTYKRNTADVAGAAEIIRRNASHLRAVVMVAVEKPAAKFVERIRRAGLNLTLTNLSVVSASELAEELVANGPQFAEGIIVTQIVPLPTSQSTAIMRYQEALRRFAPSEAPDYVSLEAYIEGLIVVEALKRAGRNLTTETIVDAMENIHGFDLGIAAPINFEPSEHQGSHKMWGTVLDRNGQYRSFDME
jgi:branched-chain amino acid transport system substrate-binding protein